MKRTLWLVILAALIGGAVWGWFVWHPGPEQAIRKRMASLQNLASFSSSEGNFAKVANIEELVSLFTPDVVISVQTQGFDPLRISGRSDLRDWVKLARFRLGNLEVKFLDVAVTLSEDQNSAEVETTGRAMQVGDDDFFVQELKFHFIKTDHGWLISRVDSVKTLTRALERRPGPPARALAA